MQTSLEFEAAAIRRDRGVLNAAIGAEHAQPGWSISAYEFLRGHAEKHAQFMAEDVLKHMRIEGLQLPVDGRALGAIFQRGAREGLIKKIGYAPAATSNLAPKCVWVSLVYRETA